MSKKALIVLLLIFGFLFRIWFARLVPQPFVFDQDQYYGFALGITKEGLHADIYRLYGYPLVITPLIYFFGVKSALPWTIFHAAIDTATAFLIFLMAKKLFKQEKVAWISFIIYLFNPFTAGYVGVLLSEIVTIFFVTLIFYLLLSPHILLLSFLLGFLPQLRPAFVGFSIAVFIAMILKRRVNLFAVFLFCLPFTYNVAANWNFYHEIAPLSVDRVFAREFYSSLFIGRGLAFTDTQFGVWPKEAIEVWTELALPKNSRQREAVAQKYIDLAITKIQSDPIWFIESRIAKMGYVWEKHFVFPYTQGHPNQFIKNLTYWGNLVLLAVGFFGTIRWIKEKKNTRWFGYVVIFLLFYISAIYSISTSEERFSLPAYPMIILFAAYGIKKLSTRV